MIKYKISFSEGSVPAALRDSQIKQVLMLGYMNQETFDKMIGDGMICFYSWSKQRLWTKGGTSSHTQRAKDIHVDCDNDTTLIDAVPDGPTCHAGSQGCFNTEVPFSVQTSAQTVQDSAQSNNGKSYTRYLLTGGIEKTTKKHGEEAFEVVIEAIKGDRKAFVSEVADELYHLSILVHVLGVDFSEIEVELTRRYYKCNNFRGGRQNIEQW